MSDSSNSLVIEVIQGAIDAQPKLSAIVDAGMNNPSSPDGLITLARAGALSAAGALPTGPELRKIHLANVEHQVALSLAGLNDNVALAFRKQAWDMYRTGEFLNVRVPNGDAVVRFTEFKDWYGHIRDQRKLDPTIASATQNCVERLLPAVVSGQVKAAGTAITVDDVMVIERSKLEVMMHGAMQLLDEYAATGDLERLNKLGEVIKLAQTETKQALKKSLGKKGLRGTKVKVMDCYRVDLDGEQVAYTVIANPAQQKFLEGILDGRLDIKATLPLQMLDVFGIHGGYTDGPAEGVDMGDYAAWLTRS